MYNHHLTDVSVVGQDGSALLEGGPGTATGDYKTVTAIANFFRTLPTVGACYTIMADNMLPKNMKCVSSGETPTFVDDPECPDRETDADQQH